MDGLVADVYFMRALQYIGNKLVKTNIEEINIENLRPLNPRLLYPLLDKATDLDPNFIAAYCDRLNVQRHRQQSRLLAALSTSWLRLLAARPL